MERATDGILSKAALIVIAAMLLVAAGASGLVDAVTARACGARPRPHGIFSAVSLLLTGDPSTYTAPAGCALPVAPIRWAALGLVLLVLAAGTGVLVTYVRYRRSDRPFVHDLKSRVGFATGGAVSRHLPRRAALRRAALLRPGLADPKPTDVAWRVGRSRGMDVFVSIEDSVALEGPPRSGKGYRVLIPTIIDWSGPLVTTSTTTDNLAATLHLRRQRGDVAVFDPQGLSGVPTIQVSPIAGCEDPLVATQRGAAIITGTALGDSTTNLEWAAVAATVLSRLLHAAAISQATVADLYAWGSTPALARAAVDILRRDGATGWGDALEAILVGDDKLLASTWFGVQSAVAPLAIPQIRHALQPSLGATSFSPDEFLKGDNTLYLIGSGSGAGAMGGFLSALLDDVVEVARRRALATPGGRLERPLGLVLDELVNMFRWQALPRVMADGGGRGICTFVVLQALSQAETAWSRAEADTIWAAATAKILLGGASHVAHLRDIETLLGTRRVRRTEYAWTRTGASTSERYEQVPLMSVDEIRRMPPTLGLLAYRNRRGVLLDLDGWDRRADAKRIRAGKTATERHQQILFAAHLSSQPGPVIDGEDES